MLDFLRRLLDTSDFPARWECGQWTTGHGWLHILSDLGVWSAYLAIPGVLGYFVLRRRDVPFRPIFWLFAAFILACGTSHLLEAALFWWPAYRLAGVVKLLTALVSWATVFALVKVAPQAMALRSSETLESEVVARTADLARANEALRAEIAERTRVEQALRESEQRFARFMQHLPGLAWIKDAGGRYEYVNDGAEKVFRLPRATLYGQTDHAIFPRKTAEQFRENDRKVLDSGAGMQTTEILEHEDGTLHCSIVSKFPIPGPDGSAAQIGGMAIDITERVVAEKGLRESEARNRAILETAADAIITIDDRGSVESLNPAAERLFGYVESELTGRNIKELMPPPYRDEHDGYLRNYLATGLKKMIGIGREVTGVRKDGTCFPLHLAVSELRLGSRQLFTGIVRDITDQKEAIRQREETLALLDTLLRTAPVGFAFVDTDFRFVRINDTLAAINGLPAAGHLGRTGAEVVPHLWPTIEPLLRRVLENGQPVTGVEISGETAAAPGETRHWLVGYYLVLTPAGQTLGIGSVVVDVTDRRRAERSLREARDQLETRVRERTAELTRLNESLLESEERFRQAFDHAAIGKGLVALDGRWLQVNRSLCAIVGYSEAELLATTFQALTHPDDLEADLAQVRRLLDGEIASYHVENRYFHKQGHVVWILLSRSLVHDGQGQPLHFIGQIQDISARKRAEEELIRAKAVADAANRAKGEFLANMSHEIRTPMNGILGMTELALDTDLTAQQREFLSAVHGSAESLLRIINDILDFSKIEAGKLELEPTDFRLRDSLSDCLRPLALRAERKGIDLVLDVAPDVPDLLSADVGRLRQILINLVGNAVKFTERGSVIVEVKRWDEQDTQDLQDGEDRAGLSHASHPSSTSHLQFSVRDTGIGVSPHKLAAIFEPFTQADSSATRKYEGTGLGLTISAQLADLLGGRLWAESELGEGSSFHVTARVAVRLDAIQEAVAAASAPVELSPRSLTPTIRPLRILLAEDNAVNQLVASLTLQKQGHTVTVAGNGREALDTLATGEFDLVLMDLQMPELDGLEATSILRQRESGTGRHIPVVALTAHAMTGDRERCLAAGMDGYLTKPISADELRRALADLKLAVPAGPTMHPLETANADSLGDPALDRRAFQARVGHSMEAARGVTAIFVEDWPRLREKLHAALASADPAALGQVVHSLKGTLGSLAARESLETTRRLEALSQTGDLVPAASLVTELEQQVERLQAALADLGREGKP